MTMLKNRKKKEQELEEGQPQKKNLMKKETRNRKKHQIQQTKKIEKINKEVEEILNKKFSV
jgi:hypothetical protein